MKKSWLNLFLIVLAINIIFTCNVFAQERVIEEELVLKDPTVSAPKKWAIGISGEYWYVGGDYTITSDGTTVAEGTIDGDMYGGNFLIGYGNWTVQASYREADWDVDLHSTIYHTDYTSKQEQDEKEITLRYLMRGLSSRHFAPYIIAGYTEVNLKDTQTIKTPGWIWTRSGTNVIVDDYTYKAPMLGLGAVVPFNKYLGIRGDIRAAFTDAEVTYENGQSYSDDGIGYVGFLTGYWNIIQGLNLQAGGKYLRLDGGDKVTTYNKAGAFVMLGYSYKF